MRFFLTFILLLNFCCFNSFAQEQTSAIGYYTSGLDHYSKQNYKEAIEHYSLAINLNPNFAEAYFQRGCSKHNADDYKGAITDFTLSIEYNKPRFNLANTYIQRGLAKMKIGITYCSDFKKAMKLGRLEQFNKYCN